MNTRAETSIVICAYTLKRWDQLVESVDSALAQNAYEVILVVDHNTELFDQALLTWGDQVRILENTSVQGLSGARNTALDWAEGGRIAFLDDDATAASDWLAQLAVPFEDENVVAVGGAAYPVWPTATGPKFLAEDLYWVIGCSFTGQADAGLQEVRNIMGCSMLFDTATLRGIGGFNTATGRVGALPVGGEETEACIRIRQVNPAAKIMFQPASVVNHHVSEDRVRPQYMLRRGFYEGVSKAAIAKRLGSVAVGTEQAYAIKLVGKAFKYLTSGDIAKAFALVGTLSATVGGYGYGKLSLMKANITGKIAARFSPQGAMN